MRHGNEAVRYKKEIKLRKKVVKGGISAGDVRDFLLSSAQDAKTNFGIFEEGSGGEEKSVVLRQGDFSLEDHYRAAADQFFWKRTVCFRGHPVWAVTYTSPRQGKTEDRSLVEALFEICWNSKFAKREDQAPEFDPRPHSIQFSGEFGGFYGACKILGEGLAPTILAWCTYSGGLIPDDVLMLAPKG